MNIYTVLSEGLFEQCFSVDLFIYLLLLLFLFFLLILLQLFLSIQVTKGLEILLFLCLSSVCLFVCSRMCAYLLSWFYDSLHLYFFSMQFLLERCVCLYVTVHVSTVACVCAGFYTVLSVCAIYIGVLSFENTVHEIVLTTFLEIVTCNFMIFL